MGMRIRTNVSSLVSQRAINESNNRLQSSMEKLSSGYRINKSSDDAAGLAVAESINAKTRGLDVARRNANDSISMIQVAEGSMQEMSNIMVRLRELSVQASSDTIGDRERSYLNREYVQLVDEIDRIAKTTEFNGTHIFDTKTTEYVMQVGVNGSNPRDNRDTITIDLKGLQFNSKDLGLGKGNEIGPADPSRSGPRRDQIAAKLNVIDNNLQRLASERSTLGAVQSRLNSTVNNLGVSIENMSAARSRIQDVDYAQETATFAQERVLMQASTSVLQQANIAPELALSLLR